MRSLAAAEAFFDRIREVLHGSGHAAVGGDRVADNVDADLYVINTEAKYYWPHEVDLFHAAYDGSLRVVNEAEGVCGRTYVGSARGKRLGNESERERGGSLL